MARQRDRMEDFKDLVHRRALSLEFEESKIASILATFILHKQWKRSPFTTATLKTLESIQTLAQFMLRHQKDYLDLHRTTEQERDSIEHEITVFIRSCKEQIDLLGKSITEEESKSNSWTNRQHSSNADTIAHKHGVVLILSEKLHSVTSNFDRLRAVRFQNAINKIKPRKKVDRSAKSRQDSQLKGGFDNDHPGDPLLHPTSLPQQKQQHLDDETRVLQVELTGLLEAARETETQMIEMSALNHLMSTHVLQQAKQIEQLYDQAVLATTNMDMGNRELSHAIERNRSSRTFLLLFLSVLTFSLIFLDWYNT